jgi:hypothetical protein
MILWHTKLLLPFNYVVCWLQVVPKPTTSFTTLSSILFPTMRELTTPPQLIILLPIYLYFNGLLVKVLSYLWCALLCSLDIWIRVLTKYNNIIFFTTISLLSLCLCNTDISVSCSCRWWSLMWISTTKISCCSCRSRCRRWLRWRCSIILANQTSPCITFLPLETYGYNKFCFSDVGCC